MVATSAISRIASPDFTRDLDLSGEELLQVLDLAVEVRENPRAFATALAGRSAALLFEKPSLRTRLTFDLAMQQLGGHVVTVEGPIGGREPLKDVARNLERWVDVIVARTFLQDTIDQLAKWSRMPVVNALSDLYHPCQALADFQALRQHLGADLHGRKLTFIGDGNNVAHSLMLNAARLGMDFALASPAGYDANPGIVTQATGLAAATGATITLTRSAEEAVAGADAVYTDVWASMGQESEADERRSAFAPYQVTPGLLALSPNALFMHCLPAKRGQEVTDEVMESHRSIVFDQAENRLHAQKALLLMLVA